MISKADLLRRVEELKERLRQVDRKTNTRGPLMTYDPLWAGPVNVPDDIPIGQKVDQILDYLGIYIERTEPGLRVVVKNQSQDAGAKKNAEEPATPAPQVYCHACRFLRAVHFDVRGTYLDAPPSCLHPSNWTPNWEHEMGVMIQSPEKKNAKNDCPYFQAKEKS
jgi:hypothetical protein